MRIILQPLAALIAFIYLKIRYRYPEVIKEILEKEYEGSYSAAGVVYMLNFVAGLGVAFMTVAVLGSIVRVVYDLFIW